MTITPADGPLGAQGWLTCSACRRTWHPDGRPSHRCPATRPVPLDWPQPSLDGVEGVDDAELAACRTLDVGRVHVLTAPRADGGVCVAGCPHPDHEPQP